MIFTGTARIVGRLGGNLKITRRRKPARKYSRLVRVGFVGAYYKKINVASLKESALEPLFSANSQWIDPGKRVRAGCLGPDPGLWHLARAELLARGSVHGRGVCRLGPDGLGRRQLLACHAWRRRRGCHHLRAL